MIKNHIYFVVITKKRTSNRRRTYIEEAIDLNMKIDVIITATEYINSQIDPVPPI